MGLAYSCDGCQKFYPGYKASTLMLNICLDGLREPPQSKRMEFCPCCSDRLLKAIEDISNPCEEDISGGFNNE